MAKLNVPQRYVLKITTGRLKKAKWNLKLPMAEARQNGEIVALSDSQMLRWIDELNGIVDADKTAKEITSQIRQIRKNAHGKVRRSDVQKLYDDLDRVLFKPDYLLLIVEKAKDMKRACAGFSINGVKYTRLVGTSAGVKVQTIVFVNERLAPELRRRIDNGRHMDIPLVPAKLEAYRGLTCSGTAPVSWPENILVVSDAVTRFKEDVIYITDEADGDPEVSVKRDFEIELDESDGYGLISPSLARKWSEELGLDYVFGGATTRCAFEKGVVFVFDFCEFAERIAGGYIVKDVWGNEVDIRNVDLILTSSMLKLWNCYDSIEEYVHNCRVNHYSLAIAKVSPKTLESERATNYQFLNPFEFTDEKLYDLIKPTLDELKDITQDDYRKALLFLAGSHLNDAAVEREDRPLIKALMADRRVYDDPFTRRRIYQMIRKRIDDAKIGVIDLHANYSIICGDPYALCQHIFGLEVTGLMTSGEVYNKYWIDYGATELACFRAPMTSHNNIKKVRLNKSDEASYWYRYIPTCTMLNCWDSLTAALNGADKDGDIVYLTDNPVIVDGVRSEMTIFCAQRTAKKKIVTEEDLAQSNVASFGDDIGKVTNRITAMFDLREAFEPGSRESLVLESRIKTGQLIQQNSIDKAKGIICKPMPKEWFDRRAAAQLADDATEKEQAERDFLLRIVADKKPRFMTYIYPALMHDYTTYMKNVRTNCLRQFRITLEELLDMDAEDRTDDMNTFLYYYKALMPVIDNGCVVNRICRIFESEFDGKVLGSVKDKDFDYSIFKSGAPYTRKQRSEVERLHREYDEQIKELSRVSASGKRYTETEDIENMKTRFVEAATAICLDDKTLCDIVVDVCYGKAGTKQFAWDVVGNVMVENLLRKNGGVLSYPEECQDGDIVFGGRKFKMKTLEVGFGCMN